MKFTLKKSVSRSGLTAALSLAMLGAVPTLARADALAQSYFAITNFQLGYNTANVTPTSLPGVAFNAAATFGGVTGTPVIGPTQAMAMVGPNALSFNQNTKVSAPVIPALNYAGGFASQTGNSAPGGGGAQALTSAIVSVVPQGSLPNSSAGSNLLSQQFNVRVAGGAQAITVDFTADMFIRAFLNAGSGVFQGGNAQGKTVWTLNVSRDIGAGSFQDVLSWNPNSVAGGGLVCSDPSVTLCSSTSAFRLNNIVSAFNSPENATFINNGNFNAGFTLATGNYRFEISHDSQASARIAVPEPGTLALVGLSLVGLAAVGRRRVARQAA